MPDSERGTPVPPPEDDSDVPEVESRDSIVEAPAVVEAEDPRLNGLLLAKGTSKAAGGERFCEGRRDSEVVEVVGSGGAAEEENEVNGLVGELLPSAGLDAAEELAA